MKRDGARCSVRCSPQRRCCLRSAPFAACATARSCSPERREELAAEIRERAVAWAVAPVDAFMIDRINIYHASCLAMKLAIERLDPAAGCAAARRSSRGPASSATGGDPWRRALAGHRRRIHSGQDGPRCSYAAMGRRIPAIRAPAAQGICDRRTCRGPGSLRTERPPPLQL